MRTGPPNLWRPPELHGILPRGAPEVSFFFRFKKVKGVYDYG